MRAFLAIAGLALMTTTAAAQTLTPDSGVPLDVATRRAAIVSSLRYDLSLSIPDGARFAFDGHDRPSGLT